MNATGKGRKPEARGEEIGNGMKKGIDARESD